MYKRGHVGGFLLVWSAISMFYLLPVGLYSVSGAGFVLGFLLSMVPDKDQNIPLMGHRKQTHTVWFALLFGLVLLVGWGMVTDSIPGAEEFLHPKYLFYIGAAIILIHICFDAITPSGVEPYLPLSDKRHAWGIFKSDSFVGNWILWIGGIGAVLCLIYYGVSTGF